MLSAIVEVRFLVHTTTVAKRIAGAPLDDDVIGASVMRVMIIEDGP